LAAAFARRDRPGGADYFALAFADGFFAAGAFAFAAGLGLFTAASSSSISLVA
jgi:hypothetical protein